MMMTQSTLDSWDSFHSVRPGYMPLSFIPGTLNRAYGVTELE